MGSSACRSVRCAGNIDRDRRSGCLVTTAQIRFTTVSIHERHIGSTVLAMWLKEPDRFRLGVKLRMVPVGLCWSMLFCKCA